MDDTHSTGETWDQAVAKVDEVLRRLNDDPSRLCEATRGNSLRILLLPADRDAAIRIVIMADGTAVRVTDEALLGEDFAPHVTLRGHLQHLADVALGRTRLAQAIQQGSLESNLSPDALEAVRETIEQEMCDRGTTTDSRSESQS